MVPEAERMAAPATVAAKATEEEEAWPAGIEENTNTQVREGTRTRARTRVRVRTHTKTARI
jgi:hypothetical protein